MESENQEKRQRVALLSVYDKAGIQEFATQLTELGFKIIASGGTAKTLKNSGIEVMDVKDLVGGAAILNHRVVTLSREIHAGILAQIGRDEAEMDELGLPIIDLVCVDMYPLQQAVCEGKTPAEILEMTDVGGPTMLHAAAKGRRIVVCDPADRKKVIEWLWAGEPDDDEFRQKLAAKAEQTVADYILTSARSISNGDIDGIIGSHFNACKYGETPLQVPAGLFSSETSDPLALDKFQLIAGTAPSFNNWCDIDRLLQTATHIAAGFEVNFSVVPYIAVAVKHGNPCGAGIGNSPEEALKKMVEGDLRAILGGVIMTNFEIDETGAEILISHKTKSRRLLDGIACPNFTDKAVKMLERKKAKCRILLNPALASLYQSSLHTATRIRYVRGGFLAQPNYAFVLDLNHPDMQKFGEATLDQKCDMILAWAIEATSNSNTIALVKNGKLIGLGSGQQDRVGACKVACFRADESGHDIGEAVAASDSFFPFPDGPEALFKRDVKVIFTTSGSVNDQMTIDFCREKGIVLYMLPDKIARGFFGH